jgi:hypothetical protein
MRNHSSGRKPIIALRNLMKASQMCPHELLRCMTERYASRVLISMTISRGTSEELYQGYLAGDQHAINTLRSDMEKLTSRIARRYVDKAALEELVPVGMIYFDLALKTYAERRVMAETIGKPMYKFSSFFTWWIRESIKTYLGLSATPLRRVVPRTV